MPSPEALPKARKPKTSSRTATLENRRLRNRLSQRAARQKQAVYVKELEKRLNGSLKAEDEVVRELREENDGFQQGLLECHRRIASTQASLKGLSDFVQSLLHTGSKGKKTSAKSDLHKEEVTSMSMSLSLSLSRSPSLAPSSPPAAADTDAFDPDFSLLNDLLECPDLQSPPGTNPGLVGTDQTDDWNAFLDQISGAKSGTPKSEFAFTASPTLQIPRSISSLMHMGPTAYEGIISRYRLDGTELGSPSNRTNSAFSDHILAVEHCLRQTFIEPGPLVRQGVDSLAKSTSFMLSSFVCMAWPGMTSFYAHTKTHIHMAKVIVWRLTACPALYSGLSSRLRPTIKQLTAIHPAIIDWVPFPSVRDGLITYHSANPMLDAVICDIGAAYALEGDLSKIIAGMPPTMGHIRLLDLIRVLSNDDGSGSSTGSGGDSGTDETAGLDVADHEYEYSRGHRRPKSPRSPNTTGTTTTTSPASPPPQLAPDVETLFTSPVYAHHAFKAFRGDHGAYTFRLTGSFFEKYPEMYDPRDDVVARGVLVRPPAAHAALQAPTQLDTETFRKYQQLARWTFDTFAEPALRGSLGGLSAGGG